jgi:hypothetical protein
MTLPASILMCVLARDPWLGADLGLMEQIDAVILCAGIQRGFDFTQPSTVDPKGKTEYL